MFPIEAGDIDPKDRIIPKLPGNNDFLAYLFIMLVIYFYSQPISASVVSIEERQICIHLLSMSPFP